MNGKVASVFAACLLAVNAGLILPQLSSYLEGVGNDAKTLGLFNGIVGSKAIAGSVLQATSALFAHPLIAGFEHQQLSVPDGVSNRVEVTGAGIPTGSKRITADGQERVFLHPGTPPRLETRESVPIREETEETAV